MRASVAHSLRAPRGLALVAALSAAIGAAVAPARAQVSDLVDRSALRVCADPGNMPFSNEAGEGFENKIAELLAKDLGLPLEYTWYPLATGFYRMTLGSKRCDVVLGYVAGGDPVLNTNPYYTSAYVLVVPKGGPLDGVATLADERLKARKLGIVAGTPPADLMTRYGLIATARPYSLVVDRRYESPAEEMVAHIAKGEIDGGVLWGPIAGYYASRSEKPLTVVPLVKEQGRVPLVYRMAFGIRPGELNWKHRLNDFITKHQSELNAILAGYGVPLLDNRNQLITVGK